MPWPVCTEAHPHGRGRRPGDVHREREVLAAARAREPYEGLRDRIDAWEEALEEEAELREDEEDEEDEGDGERGDGEYGEDSGPVSSPYDLSIPPGRRVGGYASWNVTDPYPMDCAVRATPLRLLLTVDTSEWNAGSPSWTPVEDRGLRPAPHAAPTGVVVGNHGELDVFGCPADPGRPTRWSVQ
ncbi:hypothetical protein [Streptomyces bikiniensis]|uniref:hypothetical protein n=1 Tax=Streptomyces bikiniensis TaxID=1896 RepID=UPI0009975A11|nr:hypothetical protein [Streptomyces bikiniensis]